VLRPPNGCRSASARIPTVASDRADVLEDNGDLAQGTADRLVDDDPLHEVPAD
jgi:hypothetical protein